MKLFGRLWPTGRETAGWHLAKLLSCVGLIFAAIALFGVGAAQLSLQMGWIKEAPKAYYDINDPMCHSSEGNLIIWINSDNWITVTGTDQEEIAELVAKRIGRKDKP